MGIFKKNVSSQSIEKLKAERNINGLVKILHSQDSQALQAVKALGEIGNRAAVEPLLVIFEDETRDILHSEVAHALATIGDVRAVEPLIKALEKQASVSYAAEALGELGDSRAIEPLIKQLGRRWPGENEKIAYALAKLGTKSLNPLLAVLRNGNRRDTREYAALTLGLLSDSRAVEPLINALDDEDWMVKQAAAKALGRIGDPRAIKPLIKKIDSLPMFAIALVKIGGEDAEQAVIYYWLTHMYASKHWPDEIILAIISRAERISDSRIVEALNILLHDDRDNIREIAAAALKRVSRGA